MKFILEFQATLSHDEETKTVNIQNMLSAGEILELHGTKFKEFSNISEAIKDVEHLVAKNQIEFEWTDVMHPPQIDATNPKYNKYWFVKDDGKTVTATQTTTQTLDGSATLKNVKDLENAMTFMEGLGIDAAPSTVQITHAKYDPFMQHCDALRTSCLFICTNITPYIYIHN